jgi:hypothetical protein
MRETKVKICDVEDFETVKRLEEIGVDFIGIHMMNEVKDKKSKPLAQCKANLRAIDPVAVTRTKNLSYTFFDQITNLLEHLIRVPPPSNQANTNRATRLHHDRIGHLTDINEISGQCQVSG